jgi:hypothetical protein
MNISHTRQGTPGLGQVPVPQPQLQLPQGRHVLEKGRKAPAVRTTGPLARNAEGLVTLGISQKSRPCAHGAWGPSWQTVDGRFAQSSRTGNTTEKAVAAPHKYPIVFFQEGAF